MAWWRPYDMEIRSIYPDSKVHGAIMGPIWGRQEPGGPHVGPMNFAIWVLSHCCHIFLWLCVWDGCTIICCWFHIYPRKAGFCDVYCCALLWCVQIIEYIMTWWSYSFCLHITLPQAHYHHYADPPGGILCWTFKMLVRYILSRVYLRLS